MRRDVPFTLASLTKTRILSWEGDGGGDVCASAANVFEGGGLGAGGGTKVVMMKSYNATMGSGAARKMNVDI